MQKITKNGELVLSMDQFPNSERELLSALSNALRTDNEGRKALKKTTLINVSLSSTGEMKVIPVPRYFQNIDWVNQAIQYAPAPTPQTVPLTPLALLSVLLKFPKLNVLKVENDFAPIWVTSPKGRDRKIDEVLPDGSKVKCLRVDFKNPIEEVEEEFICKIAEDLYITDHTNKVRITSVWFNNFLKV